MIQRRNSRILPRIQPNATATMNIASIDFETANNADASICAAGLAVFQDGILAESLYWLVRPPKGFGWFREDFTECHGLTWFDVQNAPEFPAIAPEFLHRLTRADLVIAHNAAFDERKLRGTLSHFGFECPDFEFFCTLQMSRRVWPDLPISVLEPWPSISVTNFIITTPRTTPQRLDTYYWQ